MGPDLLKDEQVWDLTDWLLENDKFQDGVAQTRSLDEVGYPQAKLIARQVRNIIINIINIIETIMPDELIGVDIYTAEMSG